MKKLITILILCLLLSMTSYAAENDTTATLTIKNLASYGGVLELYKDNGAEPVLTQVIPNGATSISINDLSQGNYRVIIRGGVVVYEALEFVIVTTYNSETGCYETEDVELVAKYEEPGITKLADRETAKVGDIVHYTLQIALPVYAEEEEDKICIITDMPSEGLAIDLSTVKVYACDENYQKAESAIQMDDIANITMDDLGLSIEITDYDSFRERVSSNYIVVEYDAVVTEYAGSFKSTENSATLIWRDGEDEDSEEIYTYRIQILKKAEDGTSLAGAVFTLSQDGKVLKFQKEKVDGAYVLYPDQSETDTSKFTTELAVDENGALLIKGLDLGVYTLREVKAPEGYFLETESITIVLQDKEPDGTLDLGDINPDKRNQVDVIVYNYKTIFDVPVTGSGSFGMYLAFGAAFIGLGLGLVLYGKKAQRS